MKCEQFRVCFPLSHQFFSSLLLLLWKYIPTTYVLGANACIWGISVINYFLPLVLKSLMLLRFYSKLKGKKIALCFYLFLKGHTFIIICRIQTNVFSYGDKHCLDHINIVDPCLFLTFCLIFGSFLILREGDKKKYTWFVLLF